MALIQLPYIQKYFNLSEANRTYVTRRSANARILEIKVLGSKSSSQSRSYLARSARRNVLASSASLASSNGIPAPCPVRARSLSTQNVHICAGRGDRAFDIRDGEVRNRETSSRSSS
jgi:hypothetical protein